MLFDYTLEDYTKTLFTVKVDDGQFILENAINSIDIDGQQLVIKFTGEYFDYSNTPPHSALSHLFKAKPIDTEEIYAFCNSKENYHKITFKLLNRQGVIIKETIYHNCTTAYFMAIDDNKYEWTLIVPTVNTDFPN